MSSRLGIGGARFHVGGGEGEAETVYLGVFRRATLERLGGFDEHFHRAQDWELNHRIRVGGGRIWFSPDLWVTYRPRSSWKALRPAVLPHRPVAPAGRPGSTPRPRACAYLAPPVAVVAIVAGTARAAWRARRRSGGAPARRLVPGAYVVAVVVGSQLIAPGRRPARARLAAPGRGDDAHDLGRGLPRPAAPARPALAGGAPVQGEGAGVTPAPGRGPSARRVLMLVQSPVAGDSRVLREAEALAAAGHAVHVVGRGVPEGFAGPDGVSVASVGRGGRPAARPARRGRRPGAGRALRRRWTPLFDAARWLLLPEHRARVERAWRDGAGELVRAHVREHGVPDVVHAHDFNTLELAAEVADQNRRRARLRLPRVLARPGPARPPRAAAPPPRGDPRGRPAGRAPTSC